jgi:hypothetical protein
MVTVRETWGSLARQVTGRFMSAVLLKERFGSCIYSSRFLSFRSAEAMFCFLLQLEIYQSKMVFNLIRLR